MQVTFRLRFFKARALVGAMLFVFCSSVFAFSSVKTKKAKRQDGCFRPNPTIGETCEDGTIYIGRDSLNRKLVTAPGNCSHEPSGTHYTTPTEPFTPTCNGTTDASVAKAWGAYTFTTGLTGTTDGYTHTVNLALNYTTTRAAKYCYYNRYGGYSDWYLPAKGELNLFWTNRVAINANPTAGVNTGGSYYWSSTEYSATHAWVQKFNDGQQFSGGNRDNTVAGNVVRCIRRHP